MRRPSIAPLAIAPLALAPLALAPLALASLALALASCGEGVAPPPARTPYEGPEPAVLDCLPDLDGRLEAAEMRAALGVPVSYLVSAPGEERPVDLEGEVSGDGRRTWDLGVPDDDPVAQLAAGELAGRWYASSFPGGAFVSPFDAAGTLEGVYSEDDEALWLHGLASVEADPADGRTLLVYDAPVALFRFPVEPGAAWVSVGEARNATIRGIPYAGRDTYEASASAAGTLVLPDLTFTQAHQVRFHVTVQPAVGAAVSRRQVSFLFECFGEVARVTSRPGEPEEDFTLAAEIRRLGL